MSAQGRPTAVHLFSRARPAALPWRTQASLTLAPSRLRQVQREARVGSPCHQRRNLAETGSSSATSIIAGIAILPVAISGASVLYLRKKKTIPRPAPSDNA
ncbi:LAETG motif-containing sortase-dependent surface protein [Streptomyces kronopolitis]|uniref:LAETG motif-containing sortase-dependent surface protein n=1 Tax=Streptomyces kronopolitis TaxID=1612435 RepID=UPI0036C58094